MHNYQINSYLKIIFFISSISLISALFIEYVLGYQPCNLCLIQRIPYALCIILILLNYFQKENSKFIILLLILTFSFSTLISFYHFGIEQGFFIESLVCDAKNLSQNLSKEDILNQLTKNNISCKTVTFRVFGLSLATINTIFSLILSGIFFKMFKNNENY